MNDLKISKLPFLISKEDRMKCIEDVENIVRDGTYCKTVPPFQTFPDLLGRNEEHWQRLSNYLHEIFRKFCNSPVEVFSWAFINMVGVPGAKERGWHNHYNPNIKKISSIAYLQCENINNGTMFDMGDYILMPKVDVNSIYAYDSKIVHTPSYWNYEQSKINRVVLASEVHILS